MKVLETRDRGGLKFRRYRLDDGRTLRTYEVPEAVLKGVGMQVVRKRLVQWQRAEAQRHRNVQLCDMLRSGVKPAAIAHALGLTDRHVQRVRKKMRDGADSGV